MLSGHSLIVQMKRSKQNLERIYFYLRLCVFQFLCRRLKSIGSSAISIFVKKYGLHNCKPFIVPFVNFLEG